MYDKYGEEGMKEGAQEYDIFDILHGRTRNQNVKKKSKTILHELLVTLEDVYKGNTKELEIARYRICKECKGRGSNKEGVDVQCQGCNGRGIKVLMRQMGFAMIQQQIHCPDCKGKTYSFIVRKRNNYQR